MIMAALMLPLGPEPPCTLVGPARDLVDSFERFTLWAPDSPMVAWRQERGIRAGLRSEYVDSVVVCQRALEAIRGSDRVHASWVSVWRIGPVYLVGANDHEGSTFVLDQEFRVLDRFIGLN